MKKTARRIAVILLALLIAASMFGCEATEKSKIKRELLAPFESACHNLDVRAMVECFNPSVGEPILLVMNTLGIEDTSGVLDRIVDLLDNFGELGVKADAFFSSLSIKAKAYEFNEDQDRCRVTAVTGYGTGEERKETTAVLKCVKRADKWYLNGIGF
jgi:hypothetical protein